MEAAPRIGGQPLEHGVGDQQIFLGRDGVLQQAVGHDHICPMQVLDISQSLARELAVMDDELQLEDADVGAGVAGACRDGLHIAQPAMKSIKVRSSAAITSGVERPLMKRMASPSTCETSICPCTLRTIVSSSSCRIDQLWSTSVCATNVEYPEISASTSAPSCRPE